MNSMVKTVLGQTDKVRFEDFAVKTCGDRNIGDECCCGEVLKNIIAIAPPKYTQNGKRKCVIKCFECKKTWYSDYKED